MSIKGFAIFRTVYFAGRGTSLAYKTSQSNIDTTASVKLSIGILKEER